MTDAPPAPGTPPSLRIDKFLWFARLSKSRSTAQALVERGIIRLNGRRVDRSHTAVRPGDLVTLPHGAASRVLHILRLPTRRGPAEEAQACYEELRLGPVGGLPGGAHLRLDAEGAGE